MKINNESKDKQAEAEVVPSSSLVEVEVGVEVRVAVEVEVWVKMQSSFLTFLGGWLGWGGVVGEVRYKANLNSSCS